MNSDSLLVSDSLSATFDLIPQRIGSRFAVQTILFAIVFMVTSMVEFLISIQFVAVAQVWSLVEQLA